MSSSERAWVLAVCTVLLAAGCRTMRVPVTERFLVTQQESGLVRATTADGATLLVRDFPVQGGDMAFWTVALKKDLVDGRGYVPVTEKDVKCACAGAHQLVFDTTLHGRAVRYSITLMLKKGGGKDESIRVVELAAEKALHDRYAADVDTIIQRLDVN